MAHIEFSLSELSELSQLAAVEGQRAPARPEPDLDGSLDRWAFVVSGAEEPCLLIDAHGIVVAASPGCGALFAFRAGDAVGRQLVDGVLRLLDFNAISGDLPEWEADKIPPMLAIRSGVLARGLVRVCTDDVAETVDAISTPIRQGGEIVGSLTFFARVGR